METEEKILVMRRIHVKLELRAAAEHYEAAKAAHGAFRENCPLYRTLRPAIAITTELVLLPE